MRCSDSFPSGFNRAAEHCLAGIVAAGHAALRGSGIEPALLARGAFHMQAGGQPLAGEGSFMTGHENGFQAGISGGRGYMEDV